MQLWKTHSFCCLRLSVEVVADRSHVLHGKNIDPKRAVAGGVVGHEPVKKIFVGGLDPNLTEAEIMEHFSQYGKVSSTNMAIGFDCCHCFRLKLLLCKRIHRN